MTDKAGVKSAVCRSRDFYMVFKGTEQIFLVDDENSINWGGYMPGVEGRVALVKGAGGGIGRVTADLLTSRGACVMAVARSENELQTLGWLPV
ncbi:SDR family NAD(P)-dependent oxidoreductase, partial [Desulfocicer niacini]